MSQKEESIREVLARSDGHDDEFYRKARIAFEKSSPSDLEWDQFNWLVGECSKALHRRCSNAVLVKAARRTLLEGLEALMGASSGLNFYFGTIIHSPWETSAEAPHIDLKDMHDRSRNVVRVCGFDGAVMKLETQAVPGRNGQLGAWLPHAHFLAVSRRRIKPVSTARRVGRSRRLTVENSSSPLKINQIHCQFHLRRAAAYLLKSPYSGKDENPYTRRYRRTIEDMRSVHCLRLVELLSHLDFAEVWFGTGSLCELRRRVLTCLGHEDDGIPYPTGRGSRTTVGNLWDSIWEGTPYALEPISIRRRTTET
jgi:hypothetical protein